MMESEDVKNGSVNGDAAVEDQQGIITQKNENMGFKIVRLL